MSKVKKSQILHNIKLDRNDPCYCGSGKKYKQCCLENPKPNARDLIDYYNHWKRGRVVNQFIEGIVQELPEGLMKYFFETYRDNPFLEGRDVSGDGSPEWQNFHMTQVVNTAKLYIYDALISESEDVAGLKDLVNHRISEQGLSDDQQTYMLKISAAEGSFFMIEKTDPENISTAAVNIFTEEKITIIDRSLCRSASQGDIMFGRAVAYKPEKNQFVLEVPGLSAISFESEKWIMECFTEAFKMTRKKEEKLLLPGEIMRRLPVLPVWITTAHMWLKTHPEIRNTGGDKIRFFCANYTFDDRELVIRALEKIPGMEIDSEGKKNTSMVWLDPKKDTILASIEITAALLKVYVNSRERFRKFETAAKKIPGLKLRDVKEEKASPEDEGGRRLAGGQGREKADLSKDPAVVEKVREMLIKHYRSWPDEKIPAFGNKKPRDMVKTPDGKKQVEMMLDKIERDYAAMPKDNPMHGITLDFLRKDLGL